LYGPEREAPFLEYIDHGMTPALEQRLKHRRQALHAHELGFVHPVHGGHVRVRAAFPPDLRGLWERLTGQSVPVGVDVDEAPPHPRPTQMKKQVSWAMA
jgi:hypothetical protein